MDTRQQVRLLSAGRRTDHGDEVMEHQAYAVMALMEYLRSTNTTLRIGLQGKSITIEPGDIPRHNDVWVVLERTPKNHQEKGV